MFFFFSKIVYNDLQSITPEQYYKEIHNRRIAEIHAVSVSILLISYSQYYAKLLHQYFRVHPIEEFLFKYWKVSTDSL